MVTDSWYGLTAIPTKETSSTESDKGSEKELTRMEVSIWENIKTTNQMERVRPIFTFISIGMYIWKDGEKYDGDWQDGKF